MKKKKSFLTLTELSFSGINLWNSIRHYKITSRLNKILFLAVLLFSSNGYCCVTCNNNLQRAIHDSISSNIFMFSAFIALALVILLLVYLSLKNYNNRQPSPLPLITAAMVLGIGLGGFADGIVFHQILQWHEMLSNKLPPDTLLLKSVNMFWDGIFHLFTLLTTLAGIYLLWKANKRIHITTSGFVLAGGMLAGWGIFNLIEGIINHQMLELHHVREISSNEELWNYGFLLFGILLVLTGWFMVRRNTTKESTTP